jgi:peptide/nickel transport system permease protein
MSVLTSLGREPESVETTATGRSAVWAALRRDRAAMAGLVLVVLALLVAAFAPWIARINGDDPFTYHSRALAGDGSPRGSFGGVSGEHWFGVEPLTGRDLYAIVVYGARTSILVGLSATIIAVSIGVLVGSIAALFGGWYDRVISRATDVLLGFPSLIFMISLSAFAPAAIPRPVLVVAVIGLFGWPAIARVIRSQSLSLMQRNYVAASRAMGAGPWHILRKHLLPNVAGTVIVFATITIPANIGAEAALAFLGLGVPPPTPAWGRTIGTAVAWIATDPWYLLAPAGALFLVTFAFNLLGDGLRDALDPRLGGA